MSDKYSIMRSYSGLFCFINSYIINKVININSGISPQTQQFYKKTQFVQRMQKIFIFYIFSSHPDFVSTSMSL